MIRVLGIERQDAEHDDQLVLDAPARGRQGMAREEQRRLQIVG